MHVFITAGPVGAYIDDNKLVSNRSRGIWAIKFAQYLAERGTQVTLLLPEVPKIEAPSHTRISVVRFSDYWNYSDLCTSLAPQHHAAVMAAAVVNWIPSKKISGKIVTAGYKDGDEIQIPFMLAPRVIDRMRQEAPNLHLIGCKMLSGSSEEELITEAYSTLRRARCHVVLANDLQDLHRKYLVYPDRSVHLYHDDWASLYMELHRVMLDQHFHSYCIASPPSAEVSQDRFREIVDLYRDRFVSSGTGLVFGAVAVKTDRGWLVSSRGKSEQDLYTCGTVVYVDEAWREVVLARDSCKVSLNAPLMIRFGNRFDHDVVVHYHCDRPPEGFRTVEYAPPGTERDSLRPLHPEDVQGIYIAGHGVIQPHVSG